MANGNKNLVHRLSIWSVTHASVTERRHQTIDFTIHNFYMVFMVLCRYRYPRMAKTMTVTAHSTRSLINTALKRKIVDFTIRFGWRSIRLRHEFTVIHELLRFNAFDREVVCARHLVSAPLIQWHNIHTLYTSIYMYNLMPFLVFGWLDGTVSAPFIYDVIAIVLFVISLGFRELIYLDVSIYRIVDLTLVPWSHRIARVWGQCEDFHQRKWLCVAFQHTLLLCSLHLMSVHSVFPSTIAIHFVFLFCVVRNYYRRGCRFVVHSLPFSYTLACPFHMPWSDVHRMIISFCNKIMFRRERDDSDVERFADTTQMLSGSSACNVIALNFF